MIGTTIVFITLSIMLAKHTTSAPRGALCKQ